MTVQAVPHNNYGVVHRDANSALRNGEPGWYWGIIAGYFNGEVEMASVHGPFNTAADAGLDMIRTWATQSAQRGSAN